MIFPCEFILKVMGTAEANLEQEVVPVLSKYLEIEKVEISSRLSKGGKFNAISIKFIAESQEQLDNIYREISSRPDVIMVL